MLARKALLFVVCATLCAIVLGAAPASSSNDAYWSKLWGIRKVGADKAWSVGTGKGVTIAVVDTGVDPTHPDLAPNIVRGYDVVAKDNDPRDEYGHGTHVAGIAAAVANNAIGVAGVAPGAKIMPVRVLGSDGSGSGSDVDAGIHWAADHGAQVINLSLGADVVIEDASGGSMSSACDYAWSKGSICVVATGNQGLFRTDYSGAKAVIVTATAPDDSEASYATGVGLAPWGIAAPGGTGDTSDPASNILSTYWVKGKNAQYAYLAGTSMATPHVAGALAILRGLGLSPQQAVDRLLATARDIGSSGNDLTFGAGLVDVAAAVKGLRPAHVAATGPVTPASGAPNTTSTGISSGGASRGSAPGTTSSASKSPLPGRSTVPQTSAPGLALFSPGPSSKAHGGNGWAVALTLAGIGAIGLGVFGYRLWRRPA